MQIAASAQFPEILVSDITKTAAKRFRKLAMGDATKARCVPHNCDCLRLESHP